MSPRSPLILQSQARRIALCDLYQVRSIFPSRPYCNLSREETAFATMAAAEEEHTYMALQSQSRRIALCDDSLIIDGHPRIDIAISNEKKRPLRHPGRQSRADESCIAISNEKKRPLRRDDNEERLRWREIAISNEKKRPLRRTSATVQFFGHNLAISVEKNRPLRHADKRAYEDRLNTCNLKREETPFATAQRSTGDDNLASVAISVEKNSPLRL